MSIESLFLQSAIKRFDEYKQLGEKTFEQLETHHFHFQPNETSNSIAIIVQHLHGNMQSRWTNFLTEDGEKEWRNRDAEFEIQPLSKEELITLWQQGWDTVFNALELLQPEDLFRDITIRSQPLNVVDAINRQLAHYSYHVGQIIYIGKWLADKDWKSPSIPKGQSQEYTKKLRQQ